MNTSKLARSFALSAATVLAACGVASAMTITGSVYTTAPYPAPLSSSQTPPGTFLGSFTTNSINYFGPTNSSPAYTIGGFLNSNGSVSTGLTPGVASMSLDNIELQFTGTTFLTAGTTYSIIHDDGTVLYLNNVLTVDSPSPTIAKDSSFTVGTTGNYSFDLLYAEVNGAPAVLDFPTATTPEPSTFVLLGSGLLGAAGAIRRRMRA